MPNPTTVSNLRKIRKIINDNPNISLQKVCSDLNLSVNTYTRYWRQLKTDVPISQITTIKSKQVSPLFDTPKAKPEPKPEPKPAKENYAAFEIEEEEPKSEQMTCVVLKGSNEDIQKTLQGLLM